MTHRGIETFVSLDFLGMKIEVLVAMTVTSLVVTLKESFAPRLPSEFYKLSIAPPDVAVAQELAE
jgi:hypothetical protein